MPRSKTIKVINGTRDIQSLKNILLHSGLDDGEESTEVNDSDGLEVSVSVSQQFRSLPTRMQQLIAQGGTRFEEFYESTLPDI